MCGAAPGRRVLQTGGAVTPRMADDAGAPGEYLRPRPLFKARVGPEHQVLMRSAGAARIG
jgi:hypothetical protein